LKRKVYVKYIKFMVFRQRVLTSQKRYKIHTWLENTSRTLRDLWNVSTLPTTLNHFSYWNFSRLMSQKCSRPTYYDETGIKRKSRLRYYNFRSSALPIEKLFKIKTIWYHQHSVTKL